MRVNVHYASFCWFVYSGDIFVKFDYLKAFGVLILFSRIHTMFLVFKTDLFSMWVIYNSLLYADSVGQGHPETRSDGGDCNVDSTETVGTGRLKRTDPNCDRRKTKITSSSYVRVWPPIQGLTWLFFSSTIPIVTFCRAVEQLALSVFSVTKLLIIVWLLMERKGHFLKSAAFRRH